MICPECGHVVLLGSTDLKQRFTEDCYQRLIEYGFSVKQTPPRYQAYIALLKMIKLHTGVEYSKYRMDQETYDLSIKALDAILPKKELKNEG